MGKKNQTLDAIKTNQKNLLGGKQSLLGKGGGKNFYMLTLRGRKSQKGPA